MLDVKKIEKFQKEYIANNNEVKRRIFHTVKLVDLVQDASTGDNNVFSNEFKTHGITDQQITGYCWMFAGFNILREEVIKNLELSNFEFSISYLAYYDKLERFNTLLDRLIELHNEGKDAYDRNMVYYLDIAVGDGSFAFNFAELIKKYGVVPKTVFPDSFATTNTNEARAILSRLARKFYLELEKNPKDVDKLKDKYIDYALKIVTDLFGIPPKQFNYEYVDKNNKYHIIKDLTPVSFYKDYVKVDLVKDYVEIASYQDERFEYNNVYEGIRSARVIGTPDIRMLNLSPEDFKAAIDRQLIGGELVYNSSIVTPTVYTGKFVDIFKKYGELLDIDLTLSRNEILKTVEIPSCHAMVITGYNMVDDEITKYKIENSYGSKKGNNGYYTASPEWVNTYLFKAFINKKYLTKEQKEMLKKPVIRYNDLDFKF